VSLDAQRARIEAWAEATDAHLIGVIEDDPVSGSRPLDRRPGGVQITKLLEQRNPEADAVVVTRLDRLGRDAAETLMHLRRFASGKVGLVSLRERLDLTTPHGKAMAGVSAIFAQLERELIAQRTAEALARLQVEGKIYGAVPYGRRREGDRLVVDPEQKRVVSQIRAMRKAGNSYRAVTVWLNAEGIPAKRSGKWSPMSVRSVCLTAERRDELTQ